MKFSLALLATVGIAAAAPGRGGNGWGSSKSQGWHSSQSLTSSAWTSSTCSAVYWTSTEVSSEAETVTLTSTVWKQEAVTTEVPKTYVSTEYSKHRFRARTQSVANMYT